MTPTRNTHPWNLRIIHLYPFIWKGWLSIGWWFQIFAWKMVVSPNIHPFKTAWLLESRFLSETILQYQVSHDIWGYSKTCVRSATAWFFLAFLVCFLPYKNHLRRFSGWKAGTLWRVTWLFLLLVFGCSGYWEMFQMDVPRLKWSDQWLAADCLKSPTCKYPIGSMYDTFIHIDVNGNFW